MDNFHCIITNAEGTCILLVTLQEELQQDTFVPLILV